MLGPADDVAGLLASDTWIGGFISLGELLRRYSGTLGGRQLVLAISVPRRDYGAALIGAGWMLSGPAPKLETAGRCVPGRRSLDVFACRDRQADRYGFVQHA